MANRMLEQNGETGFRIIEVPFPEPAWDERQRERHAYWVTPKSELFALGVIYAEEPHGDDGEHLLHISLSYWERGEPTQVRPRVLEVAKRLIIQQRLRWPERFHVTKFTVAGPHQGLGVHLWETK